MFDTEKELGSLPSVTLSVSTVNQRRTMNKDKEKAIQESVPYTDIEEANKPEEGKVYALTGGRGTRCIANGNTWKDSEVKDA